MTYIRATNNANMNRRLVVGEYPTTTPSRPKKSRCKGNHSPYTEYRLLNKVRFFQTTTCIPTRMLFVLFCITVLPYAVYAAQEPQVDNREFRNNEEFVKEQWHLISDHHLMPVRGIMRKEKRSEMKDADLTGWNGPLAETLDRHFQGVEQLEGLRIRHAERKEGTDRLYYRFQGKEFVYLNKQWEMREYYGSPDNTWSQKYEKDSRKLSAEYIFNKASGPNGETVGIFVFDGAKAVENIIDWPVYNEFKREIKELPALKKQLSSDKKRKFYRWEFTEKKGSKSSENSSSSSSEEKKRKLVKLPSFRKIARASSLPKVVKFRLEVEDGYTYERKPAVGESSEDEKEDPVAEEKKDRANAFYCSQSGTQGKEVMRFGFDTPPQKICLHDEMIVKTRNGQEETFYQLVIDFSIFDNYNDKRLRYIDHYATHNLKKTWVVEASIPNLGPHFRQLLGIPDNYAGSETVTVKLKAGTFCGARNIRSRTMDNKLILKFQTCEILPQGTTRDQFFKSKRRTGAQRLSRAAGRGAAGSSGRKGRKRGREDETSLHRLTSYLMTVAKKCQADGYNKKQAEEIVNGELMEIIHLRENDGPEYEWIREVYTLQVLKRRTMRQTMTRRAVNPFYKN